MIGHLLRNIVDYWPVYASICGSLAAIVVFIKNLLSVKKLRLEIRKLKIEGKLKDKNSSEIIRKATLKEVEKFGKKYPRHISYLIRPSPSVYMFKRLGNITIALLSSLCALVILFSRNSIIGSHMVTNVSISIALFIFFGASLTYFLDKYILSKSLILLLNEGRGLTNN